jgi:replicative DNA helicase
MNNMNIPYSIEAEKSVLGCILTNNSTLDELINTLSEKDFYDKANSKIYSTMVDFYNQDKICDLVTLSNSGIEIEYLVQLADSVFSSQSAKHHAGIVKGKSIRRQMIQSAQEIIEMALNGEYETIVDFKNDALQKMDIDVNDVKTSDTSIKDITLNVLGVIEDKCMYPDKEYPKYGYKWLDAVMGGVKNSLTILAARPSIGKTAFCLNIAEKQADQGKGVAIFSLEMDKDQLVERMLSSYSLVQYDKILKPLKLNENEQDKVFQRGMIMAQQNIHIFDNVSTIEGIRSQCRQLKVKNKLDYVIVDYLQLCDTMKKTSNTNDRISYMSRQFKLMQKEFRVPFLVLSQLSRENEKVERRPKLTDLRDSGSIEQDADNVWFLHDETYGKYVKDQENGSTPVELIIAKQRAGQRDIYKEFKFYKQVQKFRED